MTLRKTSIDDSVRYVTQSEHANYTKTVHKMNIHDKIPNRKLLHFLDKIMSAKLTVQEVHKRTLTKY